MKFSNFLFFIQILYSFEFIVIPFKSDLTTISNDLSPENLIKKLMSNDIYTEINIGTPSQQLSFFINFGSYHTYILNNSDKSQFQNYNYSLSKSFYRFQNKSIIYQDNEFKKGLNVSDKISIYKYLENYDLNFILVSLENELTKTNFAGSLGFGIVDIGEPVAYNAGLIYQLKKNEYIDNYEFTLIFNKNNYDGNIIIGRNIYSQFNDDNFHSDYICIDDIDYHYHWGWNYFQVKLNNESIDIRNIKFKPEIGTVIGPKTLYDKYKQIFNKKIKEKKCYEVKKKYIFYYCDDDAELEIPSLYFSNKRANISFQLEQNDLLYYYNDKQYFLIIFDLNDPTNNNIFLGYPFLKKYDMIFNIDKRHVGFYDFKINFDENEEQKKEKKEKEKEEEKKEKEKEKEEGEKEKEKEKEKEEGEKEKEKEDKKDIDKDKEKQIIYDNNKSQGFKIYIIVILIFVILIILFFLLIQYRNIRRKRMYLLKQEFEYIEKL